MKNIQEYHEFRLNESTDIFFARHNYPVKYKERVKKIDPQLSDDPRVLGKVKGFFQKLEDRGETAGYYGTQYQQLRRAERGGGPNTGVESLLGLLSLAPNILKRVFGPGKSTKDIPKDNEVNLDFIRHTDDNFAKNELPSIKNETDLSKNILNTYKKAGVNKGANPMLDELMRNRANLYYAKGGI